MKPFAFTQPHDFRVLLQRSIGSLCVSIQSAFASGSRLMGIIHIHLMIYFLECMTLAISALYSILGTVYPPKPAQICQIPVQNGGLAGL